MKPDHVNDGLVIDVTSSCQDVEYCSGCDQLLKRNCFGSNKGKKNGLESRCRKCVSQRKKINFQKKIKEKRLKFKKERKMKNQLEDFEVRVQGKLEDETIAIFVKILETAYWELKYDNEI
jgi:hypothetical protein